MTLDQMHITVKAIDYGAFFLCVGLVLAKAVLLPVATFDMLAFKRRWQRAMAGTLSLLTFTGCALLLIRVMEMGDSALRDAFSMLPVVLSQAHYGRVWSVHLAGIVVLWIVFWALSAEFARRGATSTMLLALIVVAFTYSATSHAADRGDFTLTEFCDWLHVIGASCWGGGILISASVLLSGAHKLGAAHRWLLGTAIDRLSMLSAAGFVLVLATGIYNAYIRLDSFTDLTVDTYGRVLGAKLLLVTGMTFIGAWNRFVLIPRLNRSAPFAAEDRDRVLHTFSRILRLDALLVLLVLCAVAILVQRMPMAAMRAIPGMG